MSDVALPGALIDAAIAWSVRLDYSDPSPQSRAEFEQWLRQDPRHAMAWQRVSGLRGDFQLPGLSPQIARQTLDTAQQLHQQRRHSRRGAFRLLSLAAVVAGAGWVARERTPWQRLLADASTAVGERKTLTLSDGSRLQLNTDTALSADLGGPQRWVDLHRGEIQISTGADASGASAWGGRRPFWVRTPFGQMQALGTRFTVRLHADHALVSVHEGAVQLHPAQGGPAPTVWPGQSLRMHRDTAAAADLQGFEPDAWTDGVIAGRDMRLADLLAEIERYRVGRIVCDPRVADLRVSGLFHVRDTDQALQFLLQTQPISVTLTTRWWVRVGPEP
ncbi:FecR family protein [Hydrogenophaga pseudoflava]|uniref:FecR family protein n=1 Tax=Hydrogenophaga pseudoflava TaxID=47421 RepID=UPI0027E3F8AF|nr:FecR family protein [Hydrogenophaga pseudoflava]MDQ7743956.1 FecR family protein [Hydrogenophaga pseudoflava]